MKIIHTSDWHLGRTLYGKERYDEQKAFLDWLAELCEQENIDALLVAGDIFDTAAPGNKAQELYYRFLCRLATSCSAHIIITAGNHDSPAFLDAPRELLKSLNVHVRGIPAKDISDEVLMLKDTDGNPKLIVCPVPYLRDRDVRIARAGETHEDKELNLAEGIRAHYAKSAEEAEKMRRECGADIPIVCMGHLFASGGKTVDGDGVRELYVGTLARISSDSFSDCFDYVALGHLHVPQSIGGCETRRYSGSPIPMGFGEAKQRKSVCLISFDERKADVKLLEVPLFQRLESVKGDIDEISRLLNELNNESGSKSIWCEVIYEGSEIIGSLQDTIREIAGSGLEILRIQDKTFMNKALTQTQKGETLDDLNENDVFERCLLLNEIPEEQKPDLKRLYSEILEAVYEDSVSGREVAAL